MRYTIADFAIDLVEFMLLAFAGLAFFAWIIGVWG